MLSFSNATGNLMNRIGKLGLLIKQAKTYQTAQMPNMIDVTNGVVAQFNGESDIQAFMGSSYVGLLNGVSNIGGFAQGMAAATISRMVFRDNPQISQTLEQLNLITSLNEVVRQMKIAGASVLAATIGATPSTFTGTGNGIINASVRRPLDGVVLENSFAENLLLVCNADSYLGGATVGNEGFVVTGTGSDGNPFAFNWPLGSNGQTNLNAIDGDADNSSGNLLTNSGFEAWTANIPDNWALTVGTAGTNIFEEVSIVYDPTSGGNSCRLAGDGAGTLTSFWQVFNDSTGTSGTLDPLTQYSFNLFTRRDGVAAAAGTLVIELVDTNGVVLQDMAGNANSFSIDLTSLSTVFTSYTADFRTPIIMPDPIYLRVRLSVALTNGRSVYLDKLSLGEMVQTTTGGIYLAIHAGSVPFMQGDYSTVNVTNSRGAGGTLSTFQTLWDQLFGMRQLDLLLPSSNSPTISDSLIG